MELKKHFNHDFKPGHPMTRQIKNNKKVKRRNL